jgi:FtsP/CotA-like multicopper oxidase with cupredoxin domain
VDVTVTLADGVFPLTAAAEGKDGPARALIRTATGAVPAADVRPQELDGQVCRPELLSATPEVRLSARTPDRVHDVTLTGGMGGYRWGMTGDLTVRQSERVRLRFRNATMMWHPMHLHGHTFAVNGDGPRKDTVMVRPMQELAVDLDADNPGQWMIHCHNAYHLEAGMMSSLAYRA